MLLLRLCFVEGVFLDTLLLVLQLSRCSLGRSYFLFSCILKAIVLYSGCCYCYSCKKSASSALTRAPDCIAEFSVTCRSLGAVIPIIL